MHKLLVCSDRCKVITCYSHLQRLIDGEHRVYSLRTPQGSYQYFNHYPQSTQLRVVQLQAAAMGMCHSSYKHLGSTRCYT